MKKTQFEMLEFMVDWNQAKKFFQKAKRQQKSFEPTASCSKELLNENLNNIRQNPYIIHPKSLHYLNKNLKF